MKSFIGALLVGLMFLASASIVIYLATLFPYIILTLLFIIICIGVIGGRRK